MKTVTNQQPPLLMKLLSVIQLATIGTYNAVLNDLRAK